MIPDRLPIDPARAAAAARLPDRIAFLGFGLIGGSIAMALRDAGYGGHIAAWSPRGRGPGEGVARGIVDRAAASVRDAVDAAGLVVLAGPPLAVRRLVDELAPTSRSGLDPAATVTDVASTKAEIVAQSAVSELPFVGGHPMAGRETIGVASATGDLFIDRPWVVVPGLLARSADVDRVDALVTATGARRFDLTGEAHDAAVAAISHLPLVLSAALVESVAIEPDGAATWPTAKLLAASGWRDMTRLARGDPDMGAGILETNADAVVVRLRAIRAAIDSWLAVIDDDDGSIRDRLARARDALDDGGTMS